MGYDLYACPGNMCLDDPTSLVLFQRFSWIGLAQNEGNVLPGKLAVEDPDVLRISLSPDGPFVRGPIDMSFTENQFGISRSPEIYFKAVGVGSSKIYACITDNCDPYNLTQYGHMEKGPYEVAPNTILKYEYTGLRDIGQEILFAIEYFEDYAFGIVGFGQDPSVAFCNEDDKTYQWEPYAEPNPFYDWLSLTSDQNEIRQGIGNVKLICNTPKNYPAQGTTAYSAILHAIEDTPWREEAARYVILLQLGSVNQENPTGPELGTGRTLEEVIYAALSEKVKLFTTGSPSLTEQLRIMALSTDGKFYEGSSTYPMLKWLETVFLDILVDISN